MINLGKLNNKLADNNERKTNQFNHEEKLFCGFRIIRSPYNDHTLVCRANGNVNLLVCYNYKSFIVKNVIVESKLYISLFIHNFMYVVQISAKELFHIQFNSKFNLRTFN